MYPQKTKVHETVDPALSTEGIYAALVCGPLKRVVSTLPDFEKIRGRQLSETEDRITYRSRYNIPGSRFCRIHWEKKTGRWLYACVAGIECSEANETHQMGSRVIRRCLGSSWVYASENGNASGLRYWRATHASKNRQHVRFVQWETDAGVCEIGTEVWQK